LAVAGLAGVVLAERAGRRLTGSRARGWIVAYVTLGLVGEWVGPTAPAPTAYAPAAVVGAIVAVVGYPLGRRLLHEAPDQPPPDSFRIELIALAAVVAPAEELIWGGIVEPGAGMLVTAALFAVKHPLVDGRWRRSLGLFTFWIGLGLVRAVTWQVALALHIALNAAGVVLGHRTRLDQF